MQVEAGLRVAEHKKAVWKNISKFDWQNFQDESVKRQFKLLSVLGVSALPKDKLERVCYSILLKFLKNLKF